MDEIEKQLPPDKTIPYDLDKMKTILKESKNPEEALKRIKNELHIVPASKNIGHKSKVNIFVYITIDGWIGIHPKIREKYIYPQYNAN